MEDKNKQAGTRRRIRNEFENVDPVKRREVAARLIAEAVLRRYMKSAPKASNDDSVPTDGTATTGSRG